MNNRKSVRFTITRCNDGFLVKARILDPDTLTWKTYRMEQGTDLVQAAIAGVRHSFEKRGTVPMIEYQLALPVAPFGGGAQGEKTPAPRG